jgi:peptide/nickel transport system permease protein
MLGYALRRLFVALLVLLVVSLLTFWFTNVAVDPALAMAGEGARDADIARIRIQYGFDRPWPHQYVDWLGGWLSGDFGQSFRQRRPVMEVITERLPTTMALGFFSLVLACLVAIPLGVVAAMRPNTWLDRTALGLAVVGMAMPTFWFALILILIFGVNLKWLPISGTASLWHYVLPSVALAYYAVPPLMRLTRAGMVEVLASDYIRTAKAKGLRGPAILFRHALRNAIIPVVALAAVQLGHLLGGSVVIEAVFALDGIGFLAWEAINMGDLPVIQAVVVILSFFYVLLTFLADLLNAFLDPRIRIG